MQFARPEYLNLLWALPVLGLFFYGSFRLRRRKLEKLISSSLRPRLTQQFSRSKAILRSLFLIGFFFFGILAAARPQWGTKLETVRRHGVDLIAALDVSYSMNTEDIAPNRLEKAKGEIRHLIEKSEGDRIGLVTFSRAAVVQCPLTLDQGAIELFLDVAGAGMIPQPGTSLSSAIETATSAFIEKERKYKVIVLFTDGEDLEGQVDAAVRKAKEAGVVIYAVGIGTPQGKPIPIRDSKGDVVEYRKDPEGRVVVSSLDERSLAEIASQTGGRYFRATTSGNEIGALAGDIAGLDKKELESKLFQNYEDQFQYPLAIAILFLIGESWISERRKSGRTWTDKLKQLKTMRDSAIAPFILLALVSIPVPMGRAESIASKNNKGNRLYEKGNYEEAEKAYLSAQGNDAGRPEVLYNLGNSLIKQKKYKEGEQALSQAIGRGNKQIKERGWYNTGNTLFSMGNYKDSAAAYIEALKLNPADKDAKHNLELALLQLKQQEQQKSQKDQQQNSQSSNREKSSENKGGQKQQPQKQNAGGKESQERQQQSNDASQRNESVTKEQAMQLLDAIQNQEKEEQRKFLERRALSRSDGKDW